MKQNCLTYGCLVTGGAGFIGSHVVDALVEDGWNTIILDNLSGGKGENVNKKAKLVIGDINNTNLVKQLIHDNDIKYIFHLAALPRIHRSISEPLETHSANVTGTLNLLNVAREFKIRKFIYSSSSSVYGKQNVPEMVETMDCSPLSPYALQKYQGEQYGFIFNKLFKIPFVALRYFNVWGNRQVTEGPYALVIGKFLEQKKRDESLTIYGDGKSTRSYTYVGDVARANILAMEKDLIMPIAINIGQTKETSVNKIAELIGGKSKYIIPNPRGEFEERRKCANIDKAKRLLGWEPTVNVEDGILNKI